MSDDQFDHVVLFPEISQASWVEFIAATYIAPHTHLHRELADPSVYGNVRDLALAHGIHPTSGYTAYRRSLPSGSLEPINWSDTIGTGFSIVVAPGNMPEDGLTRVRQELLRLPEILPTRMVWPE